MSPVSSRAYRFWSFFGLERGNLNVFLLRQGDGGTRTFPSAPCRPVSRSSLPIGCGTPPRRHRADPVETCRHSGGGLSAWRANSKHQHDGSNHRAPACARYVSFAPACGGGLTVLGEIAAN